MLTSRSSNLVSMRLTHTFFFTISPHQWLTHASIDTDWRDARLENVQKLPLLPLNKTLSSSQTQARFHPASTWYQRSNTKFWDHPCSHTLILTLSTQTFAPCVVGVLLSINCHVNLFVKRQVTVQLTEIYVASIFLGFGANCSYCINSARATIDGTCQVQDV